MGEASFELADARLKPLPVIGYEEQAGYMVSMGIVVRRHIVAAILAEQLQPFTQAPLIQKRRLPEEKVFDLLAGNLLC